MSTAPRAINAYAAFAKDQPIKPWTYQSRPLGPDDVEIQISHCGVCGSDVHAVDSGWGPTEYPCVAGHEIVGHATLVGVNVKDIKVGDRLGVGPQVWACLNRDADRPCKVCAAGANSYCSRAVNAFGSKYEDGATSRGGFAEFVRVASSYAFKIPANIPSDVAAPLLCAGVTVFTPLKEADVKPGDRVGIIGIGGLGHLAIQFAKAMGATVVAFSRSASKEAEARALGADEYVSYGDPAQAQQAAGSVDTLLLTADASGMPYNLFFTFLAARGTLIMVGLPNDEVKFIPFLLVGRGTKLIGSLTGGIEDMKAMLQLASEKNVRAIVEKLPMSQVNEGLDKVRKGTVRYRVVLEN